MEQPMIGTERLDHDPAALPSFFLAGTPRASRDLGKHLIGTLKRSKIRKSQHPVRRHHPDQTHVRKVQSFGDHLGTHKDIKFAVRKRLEQSCMGGLFSRGIEVHSRHACLRKKLRQLLFNALRPQSLGLQCLASAGNAGGGSWTHMVATMMAVQSPQGFVNHQRDVAPLAGHSMTTLGALLRRRISPTVLKQDDLATFLKSRLHLIAQHLAESAAHAPLLVLLAQVGDENFWHHRTAKPLLQRHHCDTSLRCKPLRLDGRRCRSKDQGDAVPYGQPKCRITRVITRGGIMLLEA